MGAVYNPMQHASLQLANQLGALLNGTVMQTTPSMGVSSQYAVQPMSGTDPRNAGLLAQLLATEDPALAQRRIADEEAYLRNPPQFSTAQGVQVAPTVAEMQARAGMTPPPMPGPAPLPVFSPVQGGHQATSGPSFSPAQVQTAQPQQPQPQPASQPAPAAPTGDLDLSALGALLKGLQPPASATLQPPATYSPGAGLSGFQPLQSMFPAPAYQRSAPAALTQYFGRNRGY